MTCGCGSRPMVPCWGRCTTHVRTCFSGDWDVHWGYGILTHGHVDQQLGLSKVYSGPTNLSQLTLSSLVSDQGLSF